MGGDVWPRSTGVEMSDRKVLVLPVAIGEVTFATDEWITVDLQTIARERIVGCQPEKLDHVLVIDIQDLIDALREANATEQQEDDWSELVEVELNTKVVSVSQKAVYFDVNDDRIFLPKRYVNAEMDQFVQSVRLPRWLARDRGLM